ncbi:MAG: hypothetical protein INR69_06080 [Mucilaginibacter polytrichastri]|nr:hypothetical protein [Mucilaginibacter polytrichastri]
MNFLSHFYFNRFTSDAQLVAGSVLPDLVRIADPSLKIHPENHAAELFIRAGVPGLYTGWKQHLQVDRIFHSSTFFRTYSNRLRALLKPVLSDTPAKPFFVAHISLELLIDHLLIIQDKISVDLFYAHLNNTGTENLANFLNTAGASGTAATARFLNFYQSFCRNAYLYKYREIPGIAYAVAQICRGLWPDGGPDKQHEQYMCTVFEQVLPEIRPVYEHLFEEIQYSLDNLRNE